MFLHNTTCLWICLIINLYIHGRRVVKMIRRKMQQVMKIRIYALVWFPEKMGMLACQNVHNIQQYTPITVYETVPLYSIIIIKYITRYLGRNEILNMKDIEFNSVAISVLWHELPRLCRGQINVAGICRR